MDQETQAIIVQERILNGQIKTFEEIFRYIQKTAVQKKSGINYYRLLRLPKQPKRITFEDVYTFAKILKVPPRSISELVHNQIEAEKKSKK